VSNRLVVACAALWAATAIAEGPAAPGAGGAGQGEVARRLVKDGVVVDFALERSGAPVTDAAPLLEGDFAEVRFRLSDATSGEPLRGRRPAAWMDIGGGAQGPELDRRECKDKIGLYLKGVVGIRPLVDLNGYFLLVLNKDPSITVIDPVVSMTGKTSLYATIVLRKPGADWARSPDHKRLYVTMPRAGEVAVVDTDTFRVVASLAAGAEPTRAVLQHDGRRLWVGNDAAGAGSGVTVLEVDAAGALTKVAQIATGRGHHEIALSADDRFAFVTNRDDGTLSILDAGRLARVKDVKTGPVPISIAHSPLSQAIYVADGKDGRITVVDAARHDVVARIEAKPGLGPMRFSDDGRFGLVVNPAEHAVHVVDAAEHRLVHTIPVGGKPYQVSFTPTYAYVRLLDSERVQMISVASLGTGRRPTVQSFAAGSGVPQAAPGLPLADSVTRATTDSAVFVANPVENATYFYMEGMNAPSGSFANYGHQARAVTVVDRSLKEVEPGLYAGKLRIPAAGRYDVAVLLEGPRVLHCFAAEARPNPLLAENPGAVLVEFVGVPDRASPRSAVPVRVRLTDPRSRTPRTGLADVTVLQHRAPGLDRTVTTAREVGDGVYEATARLGPAGAYYLFVAVPSLGARWDQLPYRSLVASEAAPGATAQEGGRP
jgi:DNA-binding beta-propeller fold protein YncE